MEYSTDYMTGFFVGILAVFIIAFIIGLIFRKKRGPCKYDERQMLARGKAYQAAFWTLVAYLVVNGIIFIGTGFIWADLMTYSFIGVFLAILVYAVTCIAKDAYLPLKEKPGFYFILFGVVMVLNLAVVLMNYFDGVPFVADGMLNYHSMNVAVAIMFGVLLIALAAKQIADKKRTETE